MQIAASGIPRSSGRPDRAVDICTDRGVGDVDFSSVRCSWLNEGLYRRGVENGAPVAAPPIALPPRKIN